MNCIEAIWYLYEKQDIISKIIRGKKKSKGKITAYTTDLTEQELSIIEPLLPGKKNTRPSKWSKKEIFNGIFYQLKNGCNWTTLIMIDSQVVDNTCNTSIESKGFCSYKMINGIKRHLVVDILGCPFFSHCTKVSVSDDQGLIEMLTKNMDYFKLKPEELPKTRILVDQGYHPEKIIAELEKVYPEIITRIQFELSEKPSKAEKKAKGISGFVVVKVRWVIERSNAWMERCKSLVKNYERTLENARTKLNLCFVRLILKRLVGEAI